MTGTVVPTKATTKLAAAMIAEARKQECGAEAVILHFDDCQPDQLPALMGLLLDQMLEACRICKTGRRYAKDLCQTCHQRERRRSYPIGTCNECRKEKKVGPDGTCHACKVRAWRKRKRVA